MELPLLERAQEGDAAFCLTTAVETAEGLVASLCGVGSNLQLPPPPGPGEQYRFHFDMTKCIGCKCCVVACNEQNGNPADILWRRVGEIEGGVYPDTLRHYLSMGCNHCLEPTCMTGCPVDAYSKDPVTGIVRHNADACIGCQYCTWNCSYGVPQYNPERGVVGKCDMCYGRLTQGQQPACAFACPEDAIRIETVRTAEWREEYRSGANSPGMPSADDSLSTTRITLPARMPRDVRKVDQYRLRPEHPHWPLIVMTVLTQLSAGAFTSIWLLEILERAHTSFCFFGRIVRGGSGLVCLHPSPGPTHPCNARIEDVASLMAQPRSADVHALRRRRNRVLTDVMARLERKRPARWSDNSVRTGRSIRERSPVPRSGPPSMELSLHGRGVSSYRRAAGLCRRKHPERRILFHAIGHTCLRACYAPGCRLQAALARTIERS